MNNAMFSVARNLRDRGYDTHLFLGDEYDHFLPEADSYENERPDYIHQLDWYDIGHWDIKKEKIRKDLEGFDFFIGTELAPAFLKKAGMKLDIFAPHGGDVFQNCYYNWQHFPPKRYEIGAWWQSRNQRAGAKEADHIMFDYTNDWNEAFFKDLKLNRNRLFFNVPYIYPAQFTKENFLKSKEYSKATEVRKKKDFILFHQTRHCWKTPLHYKANDVMIRGYAKFIEQNPDLNCVLITFEYGYDWEESKKLGAELGISDKVLWLPLMKRKDLMVWLSIADLGIGEFGESWFSYGAVFETLCSKKPFLGYRKDEDFSAHHKEMYPMASANTEDSICAVFTDLKNNKDKYKKMGLKGYEWFMKYGVNRPIDKIVEIIRAKEKLINNSHTAN